MRVLVIVVVLASLFAVSISSPHRQKRRVTRQERPEVRPAELPDETKEVILEYVAEKMEEAYPNLLHEIQTRANLFNLSAYLNTNRPANTTALTFVPLITLLSSLG